MGSPFHSERVVCLAGLGLLWERKDKRYGKLRLCVFFGFFFFINLCLFWMMWWKGAVERLKTRKILFIRLNSIILYNLWEWSSVFLIQSPSSIEDFLDWFGHP